jgi:hypothetical protein
VLDYLLHKLQISYWALNVLENDDF